MVSYPNRRCLKTTPMHLFLADGYHFPGIQPQLAPDEHNSWKVGGIN